MKNILKAIAVTAALVSFSGGVAVADSSCTISVTGSGSVNACYNEEVDNTTVFCSNNVNVTNDNYQDAESGTVVVDGNTSGGDAESGGSSNTNLTNIAVQLGCAQTAAAPETPTTPPAGGSGEATPQVLAAETSQVAVVPVGGAGAGAGAGVATDKVAATAGILGSAGLIALGVAFRKHAFNQ